ncbi:regulatory protein, gntR family [Arachidicoccus rhizosphaerae]|uniref:Regulatory protein, gntR family n=1 Tax=Arachidicoccus rhizosphaerae TaxID=551991 RepID=A0A1H3Y7E1_9BACT|nr:GntR family transcriptional regulator [Arachidicoccus rhizosphaerae]SEA07420.1 regulatory protein, gntR family [Arachidicoccus rhizosphaerae]
MKHTPFEKHGNKVLYVKIANDFLRQIDGGSLKINDKLPSINTLSKKLQVARETIEKAYKLLIDEGYVLAIPGKGYFVASAGQAKLKILFVMNKISSFKKIVYYSFLDTIGGKAKIDLKIHHYDPALLSDILDQELGNYHYYVIMPHFFTSTTLAESKKVLEKVPKDQLVLLDKQVSGFGQSKSVYQDFKDDIFDGLSAAGKALNKYHTITLNFPENSHHPTGIISGVKRYCKIHEKDFKMMTGALKTDLEKGTLYIFVDDDDMARFIKQVRTTKLVLGKHIGLISFNETPFKELLDISVLTTDFEKMGETSARLILEHKTDSIRNDFRFIRRNSI